MQMSRSRVSKRATGVMEENEEVLRDWTSLESGGQDLPHAAVQRHPHRLVFLVLTDFLLAAVGWSN